MKHLRHCILNALFNLLYGRIVFFHEIAGQILFGESWHGRRLALLDAIGAASRIVDVGAGDGRLIEAAGKRAIAIQAFDPSRSMRARAFRRGVAVVNGSSFDVPLPSGSVDIILATYPGPWVTEPATWTEFERVLTADGIVYLCLGGSYERGPGAQLRSTMIKLAYGRIAIVPINLPAAEDRGFTVEHVSQDDRWGHASYVTVRRARR
ncbi:hypothetical protein BH23CHL2_BH23CHL2_16900 [soil metagenome]